MKTQTWEVTINFWLAHLIIFTTFKFIKEWMDGWMDGAPERWRKPEACLVWVPASALHAFPLSISQPTPWRPEACSPYRERLLTGCEPPPRSKSTMEASSCCNPPNALPALPSLLSWEQDLGLAWLSSSLTCSASLSLSTSFWSALHALQGDLGWLGCASHWVGKSKSREADKPFPLQS